MTQFWLISGLMLVLAVLLLAAPFFFVAKQTAQQDISTVQHDSPMQQAEVSAQSSKMHFALLSAILLLIVVTLGLYLKTGSYTRLANWQAVVAQLPELRQRVTEEQQAPLNQEEIARLRLGLRTELHHGSASVADWVMLGRAGMALQDLATAQQAFARASQLAPEDISVMLNWAESLLYSQDQADRQQGVHLLREIVKRDHTHIQAISMLAFNEFEEENYQQAINLWQLMLKLLPAADQRRGIIERSVAQAKNKLSDKP